MFHSCNLQTKYKMSQCYNIPQDFVGWNVSINDIKKLCSDLFSWMCLHKQPIDHLQFIYLNRSFTSSTFKGITSFTKIKHHRYMINEELGLLVHIH